jgi:hypothetical protein
MYITSAMKQAAVQVDPAPAAVQLIQMMKLSLTMAQDFPKAQTVYLTLILEKQKNLRT